MFSSQRNLYENKCTVNLNRKYTKMFILSLKIYQCLPLVFGPKPHHDKAPFRLRNTGKIEQNIHLKA
jgi:hypothetical protein